MGILKNMAIKKVTRNRTRKFINIIIEKMNRSEEIDENNFDEFMKECVDNYMLTRVGFELDINFQEMNKNFNWYDSFLSVVTLLTISELSYDKSIGSENDYKLIKKHTEKEILFWMKTLNKNFNSDISFQ